MAERRRRRGWLPPRGGGYQPTGPSPEHPKPPSGPASVSPRPPQQISITLHHVQQPSQAVEEVRQAIIADPCGVLGHRWAWLTAGGQECVQCGARR